MPAKEDMTCKIAEAMVTVTGAILRPNFLILNQSCAAYLHLENTQPSTSYAINTHNCANRSKYNTQMHSQ